MQSDRKIEVAVHKVVTELLAEIIPIAYFQGGIGMTEGSGAQIGAAVKKAAIKLFELGYSAGTSDMAILKTLIQAQNLGGERVE